VRLNGADLPPDGDPTLADFAAGELVAVKGFPLEGDTLKIARVTKVKPGDAEERDAGLPVHRRHLERFTGAVMC